MTSHFTGTTKNRRWSHRKQRLKRCVFRRLRKTGSEGADVTCGGRPFQMRAAATGKECGISTTYRYTEFNIRKRQKCGIDGYFAERKKSPTCQNCVYQSPVSTSAGRHFLRSATFMAICSCQGRQRQHTDLAVSPSPDLVSGISYLRLCVYHRHLDSFKAS